MSAFSFVFCFALHVFKYSSFNAANVDLFILIFKHVSIKTDEDKLPGAVFNKLKISSNELRSSAVCMQQQRK